MNRRSFRFLIAVCTLVASLSAAASTLNLPQPWIHGAAGEPALQVQAAAPGLWVLRQSKASNFEAPFMYLLAGERRALLLDTGAEPAPGSDLPLRATVDGLLAQWQRERGLAALPLVIAHTHGHRDHTHSDAQFRDRADTRIVAAEPAQVAAFFGLDRWPEGEARFDLGGRELRVLPLPGHEPAHIAVYDPASATLFSGDSLYPGLLTVRDWQAYRASARRLAAFARNHRIEQVLGAHIEMSATPGRLYPLGSAVQPDEHVLAMSAEQIGRWRERIEQLGDFLHDPGGDDFAFERIAQPGELADKPNTHGMLVAGLDTVYLSHLPMFHRPHNYQLIFAAQLPAKTLAKYRADARRHPDLYYTLAPTAQWVLPETIKPGARFKADLYRGHFERGGTAIARGIDVGVAEIVHFRRFEPGLAAQPAQWIGFGQGRERFAAHRIEGAPDMDQIVQVAAGPDARVWPRGGSLLNTSAPAFPSGELRVGDSVGGLRVQRVIYTEYGDLAE